VQRARGYLLNRDLRSYEYECIEGPGSRRNAPLLLTSTNSTFSVFGISAFHCSHPAELIKESRLVFTKATLAHDLHGLPKNTCPSSDDAAADDCTTVEESITTGNRNIR